jgi:hypothetical protein
MKPVVEAFHAAFVPAGIGLPETMDCRDTNLRRPGLSSTSNFVYSY